MSLLAIAHRPISWLFATTHENRDGLSRIIKRMTNMATVGAFELWLLQSTTARDQRSKCIQIVQKMLHRNLSMAFDSFAAMVGDMQERRLAVQKALVRWKTPYVQAAFDRWLE